MNRWQALVEIVRSFNDRDRPGYALAALLAILLAAIGAAAIVGFGAVGMRDVLGALR